MTNLRPKKLELAGIKGGRDITRPFFGAMLEPLDTVLGAIGRDYLVYEELFKDSQVFSNFQQRISRVAACETTIEAGGDRPIDIAAAEFLEALLKRLPWDDITTLMLYGRMFGYSVAEVMWGFDGKFTTIDSIQVRSQRRFRFDQDLNLRLLTLTNSYEGEVLPDRKFWTVAMGGVRSDEPYGLGLGHQLYWPVYFKKNGLKSWLKFLDRFGHPLPLVRHSENATQAEKDAAFYLAQSLAEDSAAAGSENLTFDLIESTRNGTADYQQLITAMDAQISKIILSQTMTTDSGSSRSQATVHDSVARAIIKADADVICASFNQSIVRWLTEFNFPGANPPRVWRRTEPDNDLTAQADRDKILVDMGFPPTAEYIIETYGEGFRPPEKGEDSVIALNGAQVTALKDIISTAVSDSWFPELAIATVRASFPTVPGDLIQAIGEQLKAQQDVQPREQEAVMTPDRAAALFGETADFAAANKTKKGGKKNCEKGKICKGSCISKTKNCLSDMNPAQLKAHKAAQKATKKTKGGGGGSTDPTVDPNAAVPIVPVVAPTPPVPAPLPDPIVAKIPDQNKANDEKLYETAKGFLPEIASNVQAKIDRIQAEFPGMSKAEAHAIAAWIGTEDTKWTVKGNTLENYRAMNMAYYNPKGLPAKEKASIDATNQLLESAYKKLPPPSIDYISQKSLGKKPPVTFDPENNLVRNLEFKTPAQTKAFLQKYKDSIGKEVQENYHLAATHLGKLDWVEKGANVQLNIKPTYGEKGQAKYVDHFKNQMSEGELIYPPGSRFKVLGIREIDPMKDALPPSIAKLPKAGKNFVGDLASKLEIYGGVTNNKTWDFYSKGGLQEMINQKGDYALPPSELKAAKALQKLSFDEVQKIGLAMESPQGKKYIIDMEES